MSLRRPHSLTLKARNPPIALNTLCREIEGVGLHTRVEGIQRIRNGEWCVTFKTVEAAQLAMTTFGEEQGSEIIAEALRVNEEGTCRLEGVPVEFSNKLIHMQLCQHFEGLTITNELMKNLPPGFPDVKNGNRIIRYHRVISKPDKRIQLGRGIVGYLNDFDKETIENVSITCQKCGSESHATLSCTQPPKCKKCGIKGHIRIQCEAGNCRRCESGGHTTELCYRLGMQCTICGKIGHVAKECLKGDDIDNSEAESSEISESARSKELAEVIDVGKNKQAELEEGENNSVSENDSSESSLSENSEPHSTSKQNIQRK